MPPRRITRKAGARTCTEPEPRVRHEAALARAKHRHFELAALLKKGGQPAEVHALKAAILRRGGFRVSPRKTGWTGRSASAPSMISR